MKMETFNTPTQVPPADLPPNVPLSQVLAIAVICGSLTFGCLYSAYQGKADIGQQTASATASPNQVAAPVLADNTQP